MNPDATTTAVAPSTPARRWPAGSVLLALLPVALLGLLLAAIVRLGPQGLSGDREVPPVERVAIVETTLSPARIDLSILNDGPDAVTIAQVAVDDAFWMFEITPGHTVSHLQRARISIPYPWVQGGTHVVRMMTSTGVTFEKTIAVATETPRPSARMFGVFTLIGLYVGVVPVALGLMWYPVLGRVGRRGLQFLMALTIGLLAYLLVDAAREGLEAAAALPGSLQGTALFVFGAFAAYLGLEALGGWLARRRQRTRAESSGPAWILALLIAIGIGLHNFGEGLAIGSAFALGELALGTLLIVGFTLHNTTEGLAIVAPLARRQSAAPVSVWSLAQLGAIGGGPTVLGAWLGAFVQSPVLAVVFLALGVGGIAQVTRQILSHSAEEGIAAYFREPAVTAGLAAGVALMYVTGAIVG